jgi:lactate dehydrogenase-like 2-hydroxyacid dehydrogenase
MGTRDTGSYATFSDVVDYLAWLGRQYTDDADRRPCLEAAARAIHDHEQALAEAMVHGTGNLRGLGEIPGLHIIGGKDNTRREGVLSLWMDGRPSEEIVSFLNARGVRTHTRKADHYSGNVLVPLGLKDCVRVSFSHYNTLAEVAQFLTAINEFAESKPMIASPFSLEGKVAVVTGAGSGIGKAAAEALAAAGATVIVADRNLAAARDVAGGLNSAIAVEADVTQEQAIEAMFAAAPGRVDILVNNAGSPSAGRPSSFRRKTGTRWST